MESDSAIATREAEEAKAKAAVDSANERNEAAKELRRVHKEVTDGIVADIDFEIRKRTIAGEDYAELSRKKIVLLREVAEEEAKAAEVNRIALEQTMKAMGSFGKFYEELYEETTETAKKAAKDARQLSEDLTAHDLEQKQKKSDARKTAREEKKKDAEADKKAVEDAIKLEKEKNQLLEDLEAKAIADKNIRALAELELAQERERAQLIEKYGKDTELMLALETEQQFQMNTLIEGIENEAKEKKLADAEAEKERKDKALEDDLARIQTEADADADAREKKFALATALVNSLSALNDAALVTDLLNAAGNEEKQEKIRKASFERQKKLNIAMALINGAQAVLAGWAQGGLPMAILAGVSAAAQLAAIVATTYQSSAGGGAGVETPTQEPRPTGPDAGGVNSSK